MISLSKFVSTSMTEKKSLFGLIISVVFFFSVFLKVVLGISSSNFKSIEDLVILNMLIVLIFLYLEFL